jgi:hypothetical protein
MRIAIETRRSDGQAKLKWHVESRRTGRDAIQLDPGKIVNRISAIANQFNDFFKPVPPTGDFQSGAWIQAKTNQACDIGQIETVKSSIVGDIEKNGIESRVRPTCGHRLPAS